MCIEAKHLKLTVSFAFAAFLAVAANISDGRIYILTLFFSFLHESVHLFFLYLFGCRYAEMQFSPGGIKIICDAFEHLSYRRTVICCIFAPVMNIVAGALFYFLAKKYSLDIFYDIAYINLLTGFGNILPLGFLDGGRTVNAILCIRYNIEKAYFISDILSVMSLIFIGILFFICLSVKKYYFSLLMFFVYCTSGYFYSKTKGSIT